MDQEIWQRLLSLESQDITKGRFAQIHGRELNARRAREINAAAKQAREYFRNANASDYSVRPLLTFYGVSCLSRALLLLLNAGAGEERLSPGHGLETVHWANVLSGDTATGLAKLGDLKIRRCDGLFTEFLTHTNNRISIHVNSAGVDGRICYDIPERGDAISLTDLLSRIPDLQLDYSRVSATLRYAAATEMTYTREGGFRVKLREESFSHFQAAYEKLGYAVAREGGWCILTCSAETFSKELPLFIHTYVQKVFHSIPNLFVAEPFPGGARYSQLCVTYMMAYILGMLVRYYPTHWISLIHGDRGDSMWPTLNRAQQFVEKSYPELVTEFIDDVVRDRDR